MNPTENHDDAATFGGPDTTEEVPSTSIGGAVEEQLPEAVDITETDEIDLDTAPSGGVSLREWLDALAGQVATVAGQVGPIGEKVDAQEVTLGELGQGMGEVSDALETLLGIFETLAPGGPWSWKHLERDDQASLWDQLGEWVAWLEARYLLVMQGVRYELPGCWYRHPVAVELLTALMVSHLAVYNVKARQPSHALVDWHTRCFEPVFAVLTDWAGFKDCKRGEHAPIAAREARHDPGDFAAFVAEQTAPAAATAKVSS